MGAESDAGGEPDPSSDPGSGPGRGPGHDPSRGPGRFLRGRRLAALAIGSAVVVAIAAAAIAAAEYGTGQGGRATAGNTSGTDARSATGDQAGATSQVSAAGPTGPARPTVAASPAGARSRTGVSQPARPPQDRLGPVVLVPGYGGDTGSLQGLAGRLRVAGRTATVLSLPGSGTGSLVADAAVLNAAVSRDLKGGAPSVDVVGYSAGGVVTLLWAMRDGGAAKARRVITLGAPFHGTQLAAEAAAFLPGECPAACRQLVPGSKLLASLDAVSPAALPGWLSLWTTEDAVVQPPQSARLSGAINVPVQSLCPAARISHSQLPASPVVAAIVLQEIGAGPLHQPSAAACRATG